MDWRLAKAWYADEMHVDTTTIWPWQNDSPIYGNVDSGYPSSTSVNSWLSDSVGDSLKCYQTNFMFRRVATKQLLVIKNGNYGACNLFPLAIKDGIVSTSSSSSISCPTNSTVKITNSGVFLLNDTPISTISFPLSELSNSNYSNYKNHIYTIINVPNHSNSVPDSYLADPYDLIGVRFWHYWDVRSIEYYI